MLLAVKTMPIFRAPFISACILIASGCSQMPTTIEAPMTHEYTQPDESIEIATGKNFAIKLVSNPTTGYGWQLAEPLNEYVVSLVTNMYEPAKTDRRVVGSGGHEIWTFNAVGKGRTEIAMEYLRSWEKDVPAIKTNVFSVVVE